MESHIRFRLTAAEEGAREAQSMGVALMAVVSLLPETANLDRARVKEMVKTMIIDRSDAVALELKANKWVDQMLGS